MNILWKIAWRNLREHKTKTLIIGILVALGVSLVVIGNSVLESVTRGMEASYVENFTGDLIVRNTSDEDVAFIGAFGAAPDAVEGYSAVTNYLDGQETVQDYTPLLTGMASVNQNNETLSFAFLWGIQPSTYFEMFPDKFLVTQGERLTDGETGIMLSQGVVDDVLSEHGLELEVGQTINLFAQNDTTGTKIREVEIVGIGYYENAAGLLDRISLVDANTLRSLSGLTAVKVDTRSRSEAADTSDSALFGGGNDELFSDSLFSDAETSEATAELDFDNILGDTSIRDEFLALDNNAWHFLLLDTKGNTAGLTSELESLEGSSLVIENWRWGAGFIADLAYNIRNILNIIIGVIAIVAVIIIMNTLVISVTERMGEIGTIRAMGGQKNFVRGMITVEVLTITLLFGLVGIAAGSLTIGALNLLGLPASNLFLQVLFGGSTLKPILSISSLFLSIIAVTIIGVLASLYPTSVALGVSPVQAMQRK